MGARLVIHRSLYDSFLEKLSAKAKSIRMGDPFSMDTQMGPVISAASRERIHGMVRYAVDTQGATVLAGAELPTHLAAPFDQVLPVASVRCVLPTTFCLIP
jgi:acyl-CoA reductase-like NAD-dependent aldehyde dehydrogenase